MRKFAVKLRRDRITFTMLIVALVMMAIAIGQMIYIINLPEKFDYLVYPNQQVENGEVIDGKLHVLSLSDDVIVSGIKCNISENSIGVFASTFWSAVAPGGLGIEVSQGAALRQPGCETFRFYNLIPKQVKERTCQLYEQGIKHITWRINGIETPSNPEINSQTWTTENFILRPGPGECSSIKEN